jgi:hypothetical protein
LRKCGFIGLEGVGEGLDVRECVVEVFAEGGFVEGGDVEVSYVPGCFGGGRGSVGGKRWWCLW